MSANAPFSSSGYVSSDSSSPAMMFVVLLALAALAVGLVLTRLVREEHRHINRPVLVNRLQAARALADEWRDQAAGEDQAVHNRIELPAHVYGLTFLDADNAVANAGRCREIGVNRLGLTGARSNLRYRNGPRGIFNSCHGMFLVPFVCWLELFVTGVIRVTDVAGVAGVTGLRDSRSASGAASVRGPRAGALPAR